MHFTYIFFGAEHANVTLFWIKSLWPFSPFTAWWVEATWSDEVYFYENELKTVMILWKF